MPSDDRAQVASYYDLQPFADDLPFYEERLPGADAAVLDLGCGTGRLLVPLAERCAFIQGIECSPSMLARCHEKIRRSGLTPDRALATAGDITCLELDRTFDLVIAPFRVFQALETDAEITGLMHGIRNVLAPGGSCILTMFNPNLPRDRMATDWTRGDEETQQWEVHTADERIVCVDRRPRLDPTNLALYPELIYRRYHGDTLIEEIVQPIVMRCWYPADIESLLHDHGMSITGRWGGYSGEPWGEGPELIVQFQATGG